MKHLFVYTYPNFFDVIVVGGGHAGTEAALASARMGAHTLLLTHNIETLGQLSCNPSIGGIGKGHLVKEIDALGGSMALATDKAGIQFRTLNSSKGPAVRASRAQIDRQLYKVAIRSVLEKQENLCLFQMGADDLTVIGDVVTGVITQSGIHFQAHAVVLTVGTFLDGRVHIGLQNYSAGRAGDPPSVQLSERLKELKLPQARLKTGTPPRIDGCTIDFTQCEAQPGEGISTNPSSTLPLYSNWQGIAHDATKETPVFSFMGKDIQHPQQLPCWITNTNTNTHDIIRSGLNRSPMFTGVIEGVGPRYCPSIEDKINRFADKNSHQIFLEPEGLHTHEFYPNGISTSLPFDIQVNLVRSIKGLENAHILRPGYAIEYDYFDPRNLKNNFETKAIQGLFFAGQINGTTGYEEAGAQGLYAAVNAALYVRNKGSKQTIAPNWADNQWLPARHQAYLGVLVDDLITKGVTEPYRMFTSRAEFRLQLREDNADMRLTKIGYQLGLVDTARWEAFSKKQEAVSRETERLKNTWVNPKNLPKDEAVRVLGKTIQHEYNLFDLLRRPEIRYKQLVEMNGSSYQDGYVSRETLGDLYEPVLEQVEISAKYAGYINKQQEEVERLAYYENLRLPENIDYETIDALSFEVRQKLNEHKPGTIGQASRITGVTPASVSLLLVYMKKKKYI